MYALLLTLMMGASPSIGDAKDKTLGNNYDESVSILLKIKPTPEQYNEYCFLMASNYFALNDKKNAEVWVNKLLDTFEPLQRRHQTLAIIMQEELKNWKKDDLNDIERDMRVSGDRLITSRAGETTQKVQKEIVSKLDKLIKEEEDKANGGGKDKDKDGKDKDGKSAKGKGQEGKDKDGKEQADGSPKSTKPADDAKVMGGSGKGKVDEKELRKYAENWGTLPPAKRAQVVQDITRDLPEKYRPMIEEYFKALNRMPSAPPKK